MAYTPPDPDEFSRSHASQLEQNLQLVKYLLAGCIFVVVVIALFITNQPDKSSSTAPNKSTIEIQQLVRKARALFAQGHLISPKNNNALDTYLELQERYPVQNYSQDGFNEIGQQYLTLLTTLMQSYDIHLIRETLIEARIAGKYILDQEYHSAIQELTDQSNQRFDELKQERAKRTAEIHGKLIPLKQFQDPLTTGTKGPEMIVIPSGHFLIGSKESDTGRDLDEGPRKKINLKSFAIGTTEITFEQYTKFTTATGRTAADDNQWGRGDRPVISVTWNQAKAYTAWLSEQTGFYYRLPTEAEWEYAARSGSDNPFSTGKCLDSNASNYDDREKGTFSQCPGTILYRAQTLPVKSLKPNAWGLYDINGNVREWTEDCISNHYQDKPENGRPRYYSAGGNCSEEHFKRILRGGAWNASMSSSRTTNRYAAEKNTHSNSYGIRVVREL